MATDLHALAARVEKMAPNDLLLAALTLLDQGQPELAEQIAQTAVNKLALARLTGAKK